MLVTPRKLKGFRDLSGKDIKAQQEILQTVRQEAKAAGFQWLYTPALEYEEVLLGVGGDTDKQVYRFEDGGGRKVGLRYDLTVPLARYLAEHRGQYPLPWRKVQIGSVWRAEKPQKGRYREFMQCDFDVIGGEACAADLEVLMIISRCLLALGLKAKITLGHRRILSFLLAHLGHIQEPQLQKKALIILDKIDKIGTEAVRSQLEALSGIQSTHIQSLLATLSESSQDLETLKKLLNSESKECYGALHHLINLQRTLNTMFQNISLEINLALARGLDYYTGLVFETTLIEHPALGSVCSGGRYDHLMERFCKQGLPCIGGSLGVDRLVAALVDPKQIPLEESRSTKTFFLITLPTDDHDQTTHLRALIAQKLREQGAYILYSLKKRSLAKQYQEAAKSSAAWALLIEDTGAPWSLEQITAKTVLSWPLRLKNLSEATQSDTTLKDVLEKMPYLQSTSSL